jgi:serine/threonine-protein kinase
LRNYLVSWNRLLVGRYRDPLVGRDVLIGCAFGAFLAVFDQVDTLAPTWFGWAPAGTWLALDEPLNLSGAFVILLGQIVALAVIADPFLILVLFLVLRREWAAFTAYIAIWTMPALGAEHPAVTVPFTIATQVAYVFVLCRVGFLAYVMGSYAYFLLTWPPLTTQLATWYSGPALLCVLVLLALAVYGFVVALGGRPLLRDVLFQDAAEP